MARFDCTIVVVIINVSIFACTLIKGAVLVPNSDPDAGLHPYAEFWPDFSPVRGPGDKIVSTTVASLLTVKLSRVLCGAAITFTATFGVGMGSDCGVWRD